MTINRYTAIMALAALALIGCPPKQQGKKGGGAAQPAAPQGKVETDPIRKQVVARVGDTAITVGRLTDEINKQNPFVRLRFTSLEQRKRFLMSMIRFEVMAQEAKKRKLDRDPKVIREVKKAMINAMMLKLRKELVKMQDITDKEIADHYQKNIRLYKQPAQARVSLLLMKTEAEVKKVLAQVKKKPKSPKRFAELVTVHSVDQATRNRRGDLGYFRKDSKNHPKPLLDAAFELAGGAAGLPRMFDVAGPIKLDKGWALIMLTGYRQPRNRPLDLEKGPIRTRLYNVKQKLALKKYVEELHKKAKVKVLDENLSKVKIKPGPAKPLPHGH